MKWYTETEYVDLQTGEVLTKYIAKNHYIINKKIKKHEQRKQYGKANAYTGTRTLETYGVTTITYLCTREGKQLSIW